ncbi:MAG: ArsR/SmtB family transcription factor [Paracoccaceae bacterium]
MPVTAPSDQTIADLARALAHPARLQILRLLLATRGCIGGDIVGDIVGAVDLAQFTVSELDLLDQRPPGPYAKEDGALIIDARGNRVA